MARVGSLVFSYEHLPLEKISKQYSSVENSIELYFSPGNPRFSQIFAFYSPQEIHDERNTCLSEHGLGTSMTVLAAVEAAFRIDFELRCQSTNDDPISNHLRMIRRGRTQHLISFTEDILNGWEQEFPSGRQTIPAMREAYKFRNWLAHGRYWIPNIEKFEYGDLYALAEEVFSIFPFEGLN